MLGLGGILQWDGTLECFMGHRENKSRKILSLVFHQSYSRGLITPQTNLLKNGTAYKFGVKTPGNNNQQIQLSARIICLISGRIVGKILVA